MNTNSNTSEPWQLPPAATPEEIRALRSVLRNSDRSLGLYKGQLRACPDYYTENEDLKLIGDQQRITRIIHEVFGEGSVEEILRDDEAAAAVAEALTALYDWEAAR